MFRFFKVAATVVGFLILSAGKLRALTKLGKTDRDKMEEESLRIVRKMFVKILKMAGAEVTVRGYEKIPEDRPVLYVGNHRSYFDILVGYTTVP
ncbi:MAG: lysophospholipid acyltransferase family protein, partial [Otoolea sp.]